MKTNLLTTIQSQAGTAGYKFMYGDGRYFENEIRQVDLTDGSIGLMLNITAVSATMERDMWNGELVYDVQMFMFRKFEMTTISSVSETLQQKFTNRMDELQTELLTFVSTLTQCNNDIDLINPRYTPGYNVTATNCDGWFIECQLRLSNQYPV